MRDTGMEDLTDHFIQFYREFYQEEVGALAQKYPNEQRSLYIDYSDLYAFDTDLAEDFLRKPNMLREYAEEALRLYDLPADVKFGRAHVRIVNLPDTVAISEIRVHDNRIGTLIAVEGTIREATDVEPKITEAAFECQRCGTMTYIPQSGRGFQEPHECQGCERQGPFEIVSDQSEFVDARSIRLIENPSNLSTGKVPEEVEIQLEDHLVDEVAAGEAIRLNGVLHIDQEDTTGNRGANFSYRIEPVSIESIEQDSPAGNHSQSQISDLDTYTELAGTALSTFPTEAREEETKAKLITPFIEALGWNKFDSREVRLEYTDAKTSLRVDYALFGPDSDSPEIVIEAKQFNTNLVLKEEQLYDYLRIFSAEWGILTNGEEFDVYRRAGDENLPTKVAEMGVEDLAESDVLDSFQRNAYYEGKEGVNDD